MVNSPQKGVPTRRKVLLNAERLTTAGVTLVLLAVGATAWWLELRPPLRVDASSLLSLPVRLNEWRSQEMPLEDTVESMLRADSNLQRIYVHPSREVVWLYIGYYGTARGGRPEHTPRHCYRAHGWEIQAERRVTVDAASGLRANELIIARDGERRLVHFWYRSYRRSGVLGTAGLALVRFVGRLSDGRADGGIVRISTPIAPGQEVSARSRLTSFGAAIERQIAEHWPQEAPTS